MKKCQNFSDSQKLLEDFVTIYDSLILRGEDGGVSYRCEYKYDAKDDLTLMLQYDADGNVSTGSLANAIKWKGVIRIW